MSYNFTTIPLTDHHTNMEFVLTNLRKYSKYTAVVRGFNRYGEGPLSQPVTTSTFEDGIHRQSSLRGGPLFPD